MVTTTIILILAAFLCIVLVSLGVAYYLGGLCSVGLGGDVCTPSPAPAGAPVLAGAPVPAGAPSPVAAGDPRAAIWSTGRSILNAPLEIGDRPTPVPFSVGDLPSSVVYTFSFDLRYESTGASWREIFGSNTVYPTGPIGSYRRPLFSLTGSQADNNGANKLIIMHAPANVHLADSSFGAGIYSTQTYPPGVWYNIVFTVDNTNTIKLYVNGYLDSTYTYTSALAWDPTPWSWRPTNWGSPATQKSIQVANAYFWPSVLTASQISQLAIPSAPSPGVASTSYYMPEPFGGSSYSSY
jgi:hypothetical protein